MTNNPTIPEYTPQKHLRFYSPLVKHFTERMAIFRKAPPALPVLVAAVRGWQTDLGQTMLKTTSPGHEEVKAALDAAWTARPDRPAMMAHLETALRALYAAEDGGTLKAASHAKTVRSIKEANAPMLGRPFRMLKADAPSAPGEPIDDEWDVVGVEDSAGKAGRSDRRVYLLKGQLGPVASALTRIAHNPREQDIQKKRALIVALQEHAQDAAQLRPLDDLFFGRIRDLCLGASEKLSRDRWSDAASMARNAMMNIDMWEAGKSAPSLQGPDFDATGPIEGEDLKAATKPAWLEKENPKLARMFDHIVSSCQARHGDNCYAQAMGRVQRERSWSGMSKAQKRAFKRWAGARMRAKATAQKQRLNANGVQFAIQQANLPIEGLRVVGGGTNFLARFQLRAGAVPSQVRSRLQAVLPRYGLAYDHAVIRGNEIDVSITAR